MLLLPGNGVEADLGGGCGGGRIKRKRGERRGRGEARSNTITSVEPGADGRQPVVAFFHNSPLTNNYSFIHSFHNPQTIHSIPKIHQPINQSSAQVDINSIQFNSSLVVAINPTSQAGNCLLLITVNSTTEYTIPLPQN